MLKIERLYHNREVTIRLRTKESVFTKHLIFALCLSLFFHLFGALFIDICDSSPPYLLPMPQVMVETDLGLASRAQESALLPSIESEGLMPRYVLEPEASYPEMPRMPARPVNHRYVPDRDPFPMDSAFSRVEHLRYVPDPPHFSFIRHYDPVKIHVSGELAELTIVEDGMRLFTDNLKRPHLVKKCTTRFRVQVDTKKGGVFWLDPVLSSEDEELDGIAMQVISQLRFEPSQFAQIREGEIEVQFQVKRMGPYDYLLAQPFEDEDFLEDEI